MGSEDLYGYHPPVTQPPEAAPYPDPDATGAGAAPDAREPQARPEAGEAEARPDAGGTPAPPEGVRPARWRRRLVRALAWTGVVVLVLLLVAAGAGGWTVRNSFPRYAGTLTLKGLSAPVTIYRDDHAIPQLYAATADDLFTAQGYVHAQERFWEMDFRRHVTSGRLSEMFGASEVSTDEYLRVMGWRQVAQQEWAIISPESRRYLTDYANGVNAWLAGHSGSAASLEYAVLGLTNSSYTIEPWEPVDSLAWLKAMAYDLRGNLDDELARAQLAAAGLSDAQVEQLYPAYPYDTHRSIVDGSGLPSAPGSTGNIHGVAYDGGTATPVLQALGGTVSGLPDLSGLVGAGLPGIGSNSWVISGKLTGTGKPLLANDPHLAPSMPGIWYQMGLHCGCDIDVEGFTFSGMPGVIIGHNARVAWGFTNLGPDVTDLYLEKLSGNRYQVDGEWKDLAVRTETIKVAGGDPVTLDVRTTNNGPLLSDASDDMRKVAGNGYGVVLRWTALSPGHTMDALFALDKAGNWTQFRAAAQLFEVPAQNIVYADVDGNIGYQAPGKIPLRGKGDGRWPAPGWDPAYNWTGYLSFDRLPSEFNPDRGYLVTANQAVADPKYYPYFLTDDWSYGYRSQRINDMIAADVAAGHKISVADVAFMQFDNRNGLAAQITPQLLAEHVTGEPAKALDLLRGWDFQQPADGRKGSVQARDSAAAAFFDVFYNHLLARTFDELPADLKPGSGDRWWVVLVNLLAQKDSPWWDDKSTSKMENRDDIVTAALSDATTELVKAQGSDPTAWRWGDAHTLLLRNASFGSSGIGPIEWLFNVGPRPVSGGTATVNATSWEPNTGGYDTDESPSMRMIVDMANLDGSRWIELTGESGHAFSPHYADQFDLWRIGATLPMPWTESAVRATTVDTLVLKP
jgi:penicillin amidase